MSSSSRAKDKAATLARIRENQRRSRARKKEYIDHLEEKLRQCEGARQEDLGGSDCNTIEQRRLEQENRRLRALLSYAGLDRTWVDTYLKLNIDVDPGSPNRSVESSQAISRLQPSSSQNLATLADNRWTDLLDVSDVAGPQNNMAEPLHTPMLDQLIGFDSLDPFSFGFPSPSYPLLAEPTALAGTTTIEQQPLECPSKCSFPGITECPPTDDSRSAVDKTPCTVAFELVKRHNRKGLDMVEIGIKLWRGFVCPESDEDEGCSVQNDLLFALLDQIND